MKKILMMGVVFVSLFFMFGCKKDDGDNKKVMSEEQFYEKLVVLDQNSKDVKQYTVTGDTKVSAFFMTETEYFETTVDLENNKYANVSKDKDGNVQNSEYVVKSGDDYISYRYETNDDITINGENVEDSYEAYYVGSDYIKMLMTEAGTGIDQLDLSTYANFSESFNKMFEEVLGEEGFKDIPDSSSTVELYEQNGEYYFVFSMEIKDYATEEADGTTMDMTGKSELKFDEKFIISMNMKYSITFKTAEEGSMTMSVSLNANYSKGFNDNLMISDFSSYPTEIEPASFEVTYMLDGEEEYVYFDEHEYLKGETFVVDYDNEVENTTIDGWYLDPACTINVNTLTDYPSYDITVYANTKPNNGYGLVILKGTVDAGSWQYSLDVEKEAILANQTYTIPSVVEVWGNEGEVTSVKVNGVEYSEDTITVENNKVYIIEVVATAVEE